MNAFSNTLKSFCKFISYLFFPQRPRAANGSASEAPPGHFCPGGVLFEVFDKSLFCGSYSVSLT